MCTDYRGLWRSSISIKIAENFQGDGVRMFKFLKSLCFVVVLTSVMMSGCGSNRSLSHPIEKNSRIGVVTNFRDHALFQRAGTTQSENISFYRRIPGLKMSAFITTIVANDLYRSRQFKVIPLYHRTETALLSENVSHKRTLTPEYRDFILRVTRGKKLDKVVLVVPGDIDFGNGQYFGSIWWVSGYGLFGREFMFMHTNTVFAAYKVYVIDLKNGKILAKAEGDFQSRIHELDIAWHKSYAGVTKNTLQAVRNVIHKKMPSSLRAVVRETGLP